MRILMIRGGALGDFIVTLPTLRLLRERWPEGHIEVLGQPHIAEIALNRHYLNAVRSVNRGPLVTFFTPRAVLDPEWMEYIEDFDVVLSYFYDPDRFFLTNLERCQPGQIVTWAPRVPENFTRPAAYHFAEILGELGLELGEDVVSDVFPSENDTAAARGFLGGLAVGTKLVAIHPGSGSETKNWPAESWAKLGHELHAAVPGITLLLVEGEADSAGAQIVADAWRGLPHQRARLLPLPVLAALLRECSLFLGHDSGITHLAAAARRDLPIVALFGPTDPKVWAPPRKGVEVFRGTPVVANISVEEVKMAALNVLGR